jgi:hypothetical protein
MMNVTGD